MSMNRADIITQIRKENPDLTSKQVEDIVRRVFSIMADALADGEERVLISKFGSFEAKIVPARPMKSPLQEGGVINAATTSKLRFVPSDSLKEQITKKGKAPKAKTKK